MCTFRINGFLDFVHRLVFSKKKENTAFQELELFPSSGEVGDTLLGPLERANFNHLRTEIDPVSETMCFSTF
jgi:hypothetical protein